jgi:pimeloyl-ACP methyl ester carboxylesterase
MTARSPQMADAPRAAMALSRRGLVAAGLAAGMAGRPARADGPTPIVFVHGNGDTAGLWLTTIWRFESNGYTRDGLFAVDLRHPLARAVDAVPQAGRSSADDVMRQLAAYVADVLRRTGAAQVILVAQSRGGNTVRNYLKNGGGAAHTALAVLCGAVDHGVIVSDRYFVGSEFNGAGAFMRDLNSTPGEVVGGVAFTTIRSDENDKFAQPDGRYIGLPGIATGLSFDAPDLKGASKIVLPGVDHRETGYSPAAFTAIYGAVTGQKPATMTIVPEERPVLTGKVSGFADGAPTNIGLAGADVTIWRTDPQTGERQGEPVHRAVTGADGHWGMFAADSAASHEFVVAGAGYPTTHIYRSALPRGSRYLNIRLQPASPADAAALGVVYMSRPRGYFGLGRDTILLNGAPAPGIPAGVPSVSTTRLAADPNGGPVRGVFNQEAITARVWPMRDNHVSVIELTY